MKKHQPRSSRSESSKKQSEAIIVTPEPSMVELPNTAPQPSRSSRTRKRSPQVVPRFSTSRAKTSLLRVKKSTKNSPASQTPKTHTECQDETEVEEDLSCFITPLP